MTGAFAWGAVPDGEAEHDGREPDADLEPDADDEDGHDEEGLMRVAEFLDTIACLPANDKAAVASTFRASKGHA